jgi:hypothetical protein
MRLSLSAPLVCATTVILVALGAGCLPHDECDMATYAPNCDGDVYRRCEQGDLWTSVFEIDCGPAEICVEGDGEAGCVTPIPCTESGNRCSDDGTSTLYCNVSLGHYAIAERCGDNTCFEGTCVDPSLSPCSEAGDSCSADQHWILTCDVAVGYVKRRLECYLEPNLCVVGADGKPACVERSLTPCTATDGTCSADGRFIVRCDVDAGYLTATLECGPGYECVADPPEVFCT